MIKINREIIKERNKERSSRNKLQYEENNEIL
jgi:hypothetical protein